jgi:hypothetical protein
MGYTESRISQLHTQAHVPIAAQTAGLRPGPGKNRLTPRFLPTPSHPKVPCPLNPNLRPNYLIAPEAEFI